jgi:signal transduction histidine kinase
VQSIEKRADPAGGLRVSPQADGPLERGSPPGLVRRAATAAVTRSRAVILPLCCLLFVASAAVAMVAVPDRSAAGQGVTVDDRNVVVSVSPGSRAWTVGIRPGWVRLMQDEGGGALYGLGTDTRPVPGDRPDSALASAGVLVPSLVALALATALLAAKQRRTGLTVAVAAAVLSSPIWMTRLGTIGDLVAVLPVALAAVFAWQVAAALGALPQRRGLPSEALAALVSVAAFAASSLAFGLIVGIAAATAVCLAAAWMVVIWWRAGEASARPGPHPPLAIARAVDFDMLPYSGRARRSGAQDERDRLASDLHAEVLPAIASTAAALERRGATDEAESLRSLASSVRDLVSERRLPILADQGLVAAAEWLAESLQQRSALVIDIDLGGDGGARQPEPVERAAYRILLLALENVISHAGAATAIVAISGGPHHLDLTVADDGRGLSHDEAARSAARGRLGLADMHHEAEGVGATLEIMPRSPCGTIVAMRWRG